MKRVSSPIVTKTENRPRATLSVTSSISASFALGSFSFSYVVLSSVIGDVTEFSKVEEEVGVTREGERENRDGESTRKSRC